MQKLFNLAIIVLLIILIVIQYIAINNKGNTLTVVFISPTQDKEFLYKTPKKGLKEALEYYNVKYPEIVYAQAILETGHFKSRICKEYNNLFGLYNSSKKDYYKFEHWSDSVKAYVDYIQYKYIEGDYYIFLRDLGYAEDSLYINKLKRIVEHDKRRNK